jgi:hypothetical protein
VCFGDYLISPTRFLERLAQDYAEDASVTDYDDFVARNRYICGAGKP